MTFMEFPGRKHLATQSPGVSHITSGGVSPARYRSITGYRQPAPPEPDIDITAKAPTAHYDKSRSPTVTPAFIQQRDLAGAQTRMPGGHNTPAQECDAVTSAEGAVPGAGRNDDTVRTRLVTTRCPHMLQMLRHVTARGRA
jgi:hypothetical protein